MLRLAGIAALLDAVVHASDEHLGADTALLSLYHTAELYAYAARDAPGAPSNPTAAAAHGLMAHAPHTPLASEERARLYSAVSVAAWRAHLARTSRAAPTPRTARGRSETPPEPRTHTPRRLTSAHHREHSDSPETLGRMPSASVRFDGLESGERSPAVDTDASSDLETLPLLLDGEHGRLLVVPVLISSLTNATETAHTRRRHRASLARHDRSRRASHTGSSDAAQSRPAPAFLRSMGGTTDEGTTDTGFSTEDELPSGADTDRDSVRSGGRRGGEHGTVMLLTLRAPKACADDADAERVWQALQRQAACFSEANTPDTTTVATSDARVAPA
ncbi:hypothetical protein MOBT1_001976 [Malassezia obtusa]|uniref:Uncharacterized protein n=1 Tax=Malassezia obtusa TaxID=76774 RepID=A0AAF0IS79_9BASI|nr:hypothetical protein MOBT1_001976 [Malassezia obtusa]